MLATGLFFGVPLEIEFEQPVDAEPAPGWGDRYVGTALTFTRAGDGPGRWAT